MKPFYSFLIIVLTLGLLSACASTQEKKQCSKESAQQNTCNEEVRRPSGIDRSFGRAGR